MLKEENTSQPYITRTQVQINCSRRATELIDEMSMGAAKNDTCPMNLVTGSAFKRDLLGT